MSEILRADKGSIPYALFWDWDHSTTWCLNVPGSQNAGVFNGYTKCSEYFVKDYKRMIDWAQVNGINAVGIVGMLRDRHGGIDDARRICAYGMEHNVRVYIIAGLFAYGGMYYEGDSPYSMSKFLEENPECAGKNADGSMFRADPWGYYGNVREPQGCPSNPRLREYVLDSLDWLFKTIPELGGIQMESGDNGVCQCELCKARRGEKAYKSNKSIEDMASIYPDAANVVWGRNPDAWVICETYHHFKDAACEVFNTPDASKDLQKLFAMPEKTFFQWSCDAMLEKDTWHDEDRLPEPMRKFNHVMRSHSGTHWRGGLRRDLVLDLIRRQCRLSYEAGYNAVSLFGEDSVYYPNVEFNYLALRYFANSPFATIEQFAEDIMAPRLGGSLQAEKYIEFAGNKNTPEKIQAAQREILKIASSLTDDEQIRRWLNLADFMNTVQWESRFKQTD